MVKKKGFSTSQQVMKYLDAHPNECYSNSQIVDMLQMQFPEHIAQIHIAAVCNASRRWRVKHNIELPNQSDPPSVRPMEQFRKADGSLGMNYTADPTIKDIEEVINYTEKWDNLKPRVELKGSSISSEEPTDLFKKVLAWKRYADSDGTPMKVSDIVNIMDRTNQLNENQADVIQETQLVEEVCRQILEFSLSIKKDPDIEDEKYLGRV